MPLVSPNDPMENPSCWRKVQKMSPPATAPCIRNLTPSKCNDFKCRGKPWPVQQTPPTNFPLRRPEFTTDLVDQKDNKPEYPIQTHSSKLYIIAGKTKNNTQEILIVCDSYTKSKSQTPQLR